MFTNAISYPSTGSCCLTITYIVPLALQTIYSGVRQIYNSKTYKNIIFSSWFKTRIYFFVKSISASYQMFLSNFFNCRSSSLLPHQGQKDDQGRHLHNHNHHSKRSSQGSHHSEYLWNLALFVEKAHNHNHIERKKSVLVSIFSQSSLMISVIIGIFSFCVSLWRDATCLCHQ